MSWKSVKAELPEPAWTENGPVPVTVLVYSETLDLHALAEYDPFHKPPCWTFRELSIEYVSFDRVAARTFQEGALITHWAPLTRPRRKAGEP
jgi:hypothetical protein